MLRDDDLGAALVQFGHERIAVIGGSIMGGLGGTLAAKRLSGSGHLTTVFAMLIFVVAAYMLWQSARAL